jgi:hypothetical protein
MEIRRDPDGTIDEIITDNFHLERMADNYIHLVVGDWHIQLSTPEAGINIMAEEDKCSSPTKN